MEPAKAHYCLTPEQNDIYDGFLDLSDPFLDLNQALGFSLASPSKAPDNDDRTAMFDSAHTAMGLSTQHHPKPQTQNALDTTPISRLVFDLDLIDNESFRTHNEDRIMACASKVQYRHETLGQNPSAVFSTPLMESSNGSVKAANGLDNCAASNSQLQLPHPRDPAQDQHQASIDPHQIPLFLTRPLQLHFRHHGTSQHPLNMQPQLPYHAHQLIAFDVPSMTTPFQFSSRSSSSTSSCTMDSMQSSSILSSSVVPAEDPWSWSQSAIMDSDPSTPEELLPPWMFNASFLFQNRPALDLNSSSCLGQVSPMTAVSPPDEPSQTLLDPVSSNPGEHSRDVISTIMHTEPGIACSDFLSSEQSGLSSLLEGDVAGPQDPSGARQVTTDETHGNIDWSECVGESFAHSDPWYQGGLSRASEQLAPQEYTRNVLYDEPTLGQDGFSHEQEWFTKPAAHPGAQPVTGSSFKSCHPFDQEAGHVSLRPIYHQRSVDHTGDFFDRGRCSIPPPRRLHRYDSPPPIMPSPKRRRRLTAHEANFLHTQFKLNERPTAQEREMIAKHLELDRRTIQVWFQNRRAKVKRNAREGFQGMGGADVEQNFELEVYRDAESGAWVDVELPVGDMDQGLAFWPDDQGIGGGDETDIRFLGTPCRFLNLE